MAYAFCFNEYRGVVGYAFSGFDRTKSTAVSTHLCSLLGMSVRPIRTSRPNENDSNFAITKTTVPGTVFLAVHKITAVADSGHFRKKRTCVKDGGESSNEKNKTSQKKKHPSVLCVGMCTGGTGAGNIDNRSTSMRAAGDCSGGGGSKEAAVGSAAAAAAMVRRSGVDGDESYAITCLCTHNV